MSTSNRGSFSRIAFVMAMAGSAIGLGNIWRFPYVVGQYGGAAFVIIYLLCGLVISLPAFFSESLIGRMGRSNCYDTLSKLAPGTPWKFIGIIALICCFDITSYYCVVGGWSVDYFVRACAGNMDAGTQTEAAELFSGVACTVVEPVVCTTVFLGFTALIVAMGVTSGIEKFTKITTPLLFVIIVGVVVFSLSLPGSDKGVDYLVNPDWSKISGKAVISAMGQSFYSLSLGAGVILVYSSYMKKEDNLMQAGFLTFFFDSLFAIIAGFSIMPAVFASGLEPSSGPSLVFETIPYIFTNMGGESALIGRMASILFFLSLFLAALSSSISIMAVCAEHMTDRYGWSRKKTCLLFFGSSMVLAVLCTLSFGPLKDIQIAGRNIFGFCDLMASNILMVLVALAFTIFAGWKLPKPAVYAEITNEGSLGLNARLFPLVYFLIRWIVPLMIIVIGISSFFC